MNIILFIKSIFPQHGDIVLPKQTSRCQCTDDIILSIILYHVPTHDYTVAAFVDNGEEKK